MKDPIPELGGHERGKALFQKMANDLNGENIDTVLEVAINIIANGIRQSFGSRSVAEARMKELLAHGLTALMEHYDPTTGRRRSVVAFDQVVRAEPIVGSAQFPSLGRGNGRT